jgi:DNA-binding GntR family transcriptional regulator
MERGPVTPSERAESKLRERLATMSSGDPLPTVRSLAHEYQVSTATVVKAMKRLREEGLIGSRPGWATYKA